MPIHIEGGLGRKAARSNTLAPSPSISFNFVNNFANINGAISTASGALTCVRAISGTGHTSDLALDSTGNYTTFGANVPRITDLGLLVEDSRVNNQTFSRDLTQFNHVNTTTGSTIIGPIAGLPAFKLNDSTTSNVLHGAIAPSVNITTVRNFAATIIAKRAEYSSCRLAIADNGFASIANHDINLATGGSSASAVGSAVVASFTSVLLPSGWVLATIVFANNGTSPLKPTVYIGNSAPYTGTLGNGIYVAYIGLESGTSAAAVNFGTSPIPTDGTSVTRQSDVISIPSGLTTSSVTLYSELSILGAANSLLPRVIGVSEAAHSTSDSIAVYVNGTANALVGNIRTNNVDIIGLSSATAVSTGSFSKMAFAVQLNDTELANKGVSTTTTNATSLPTAANISTLYIGAPMSSQPAACTLYRTAALYPFRLSHATLVSITK